MNKDIMDCIDVGTGPVTLDVVMAKELAWSREDIELASKMITTLVRGIAFRTGRGCEHCGRLQAAPGLDDCPCMPARSGGAPVRHPTLRAQDDMPALGWCGNCGNCNDDEATACKGCGSELTPVAEPAFFRVETLWGCGEADLATWPIVPAGATHRTTEITKTEGPDLARVLEMVDALPPRCPRCLEVMTKITTVRV